MVDLDQDVKDDLNQLRNGGDDSDKSNERPNALKELGQLHAQSGDSSLPQWAEYGIYAALIIAIIQIYVGIPVPDGTLLVGAALAFLVLGLWAGMKKHAELARVAERINDWRSSKD